MLIGVDTYSYHRFFGELRNGEVPVGARWDHADLLAEVNRGNVDVASVETCFLPALDDETLNLTARTLAGAGVEFVLCWGHPSGLKAGHDAVALAQLHALLPRCAAHGIRLLRIVVGSPATWRLEPETTVVARLVPMLQELVETAARHGVELAVETHAELSFPSFTRMVDAVAGLGVVLDTGNVVRVGANLRLAAAAVADRIRMVHAKDLSLRDVDGSTPPDAYWYCTAVGEGRLPIRETLLDLVAGGFDGPVCVELMELDPATDGDEREVVARSLATLASWRRDPVMYGTAAP